MMSNSNEVDRGLISWFINNPVAANIMMFLFVIGGIISATSMRTETFPSLDPKMITVSVPYPGATPYEIADAITSRVEEALLGIDGVKRIASTATEGSGIINVELEDFADTDNVYNEVETAVNSLSEFPPQDAERPVITKAKVTPNVLTLALYGDAPEATLRFWAQTIEDELRGLSGVALTSITGVRDYQISIDVSENALRQYGLNLNDVTQVIRDFSVDTPAGTIESSQGEISLRVQERGYVGRDFENIPVATLDDGAVLRIKDIGTVVDGLEEANLISKFNGVPAAFIEVKRSDSEDTLEVAGVVKDYLDTVTLPDGLSLALQSDETVVLKDRISLMLRNAVLGFMLVFLVLLLFLDLKLAFWVSAAVPISFLGGLMFINAMGYSINMITLFALIVVLGIVVDDAIVTGESIFAEHERTPNDKWATLRGVKKVVAPVTVGVTTTMAAFAPLAFSTGTLGQIISLIPVVVIPILFVSLLEAYFILPSHLARPTIWSAGALSRIRNKVDGILKRGVDKYVLPITATLVSWRYATLGGFFALLVITIAMVSSGTVRFIFFPAIEGDEIIINVSMPEGTSFSITEKTMLAIDDAIGDIREEITETDSDPFQSVLLSIGASSTEASPAGAAGTSTNSNIGQVKIQLIPSDFRTMSSQELESKIAQQIRHFPNIEELEFLSSPLGEEPDIELELSHPEEAILNEAAEELKARLKGIQGTIEVKDSFEKGSTEYVFSLTPEGLAVGLTPAELGRQLRSAFFGSEAQRFQRGRSEVIVYVRYPKDERESLTSLRNMRIRLPDGIETPLVSVASISEQSGYSQIQSVDGRRIVSVTSDVDYAIATPNEVIAKLNNDVLPNLQQRYANLRYSYEGESREQAEDLASLGQNMLIAVIIIYVLLGGQLRSYIQPVIIMLAIPFGVVGAIWGHFILGADLTFISLFGIVALTGVVVNDSVVLMDYLNSHKNDGNTVLQSCLAAVKRRFRPILLTTLTTSLGLLPMLLETSMQARFLIPMVISLATGILFVTVIVLVLLPCLVKVADDCHLMFRSFQQKLFTDNDSSEVNNVYKNNEVSSVTEKT
ncbi:MAG: efflux RND transporter permease subunit [Pseudomonadota bacterium]